MTEQDIEQKVFEVDFLDEILRDEQEINEQKKILIFIPKPRPLSLSIAQNSLWPPFVVLES